MSRDSGDFVSQLQELVSRALRQQVRSNQRVADLLRQISGGQMSGKEVGDVLRNHSEQESAEYVRTLTTLGVSFFSNLLDLNQSYNERLFQRLGRTEENGEAPPRKEPSARIELRGRIDTEVRAAFVVENRREKSSDVTMVFPPVTRKDGSQFQAPFVAHPAAFRLEPGEERPVGIAIHLLDGLFVSGEEYLCPVLVRGPEDMVLDIAITVEAEPEIAIAVEAEIVEVELAVAPKKARPAARKAVKKAVKKTAKKAAAKAVKKHAGRR
jgi:hypothetical protein